MACACTQALRLVVVAPRCDPQDEDVFKVACDAQRVCSLSVVDTLEEALADTTSSVGFTRRGGATRVTHSSVAEMLDTYPESIALLQPRGADGAGGDAAAAPPAATTALVFGREESGLLEGELRQCVHTCAIPTGRLQPSMNLSHAVAVVLSDLYVRALAAAGARDLGLEVAGPHLRQLPGLQPAAASEQAVLMDKVAAVARAVGISDEDSRGGGNQGSHGRRRLPVGHIRALLGRAHPNTWEVRALHKLASAVLEALGPRAPP